MRTPRRPIGVLLSGGLDSAVLLAWLAGRGRTVQPVYVRGGLIWEPAERVWLRRWLAAMPRRRVRPLRVVDAPLRSLYGAHWSLTGRGVPGAGSRDAAVELPGRNLVLFGCAAIACARQGVQELALGVLQRNPFGDATPAFLRGLSAALRAALGRPIRLSTPLRHLTKAQVIRRGRDWPLELTFSCLRPGRGWRHCGRCNKCGERRRAFRAAGITDPTSYAA